MGKIEKGEKCSVEGCNNNAVRSLSKNTVAKAGLKLRETRRAYLCQEHYKQFKKQTKADRKLESMRWSTFGGRSSSYVAKGAGYE